jgi:hypothetical protein
MRLVNGSSRMKGLLLCAMAGCAGGAVMVACSSSAPSNGGFQNSTDTSSSSGSATIGGSSSSGSTGTGSGSPGAGSSSSSGGTTGVGSSSSGGPTGPSSSSGATGSSSGGGDGGPVALCTTTVVPANPVLINFDTYNGTTAANLFGTAFGGATPGTGTAYIGPYGYSGGNTNWTLSMVTGESGGLTAAGTQDWGLDLTVTQESVFGGGVGFWMTSCANATTFKGISLWARGAGPTGTFTAILGTSNTTSTGSLGTCTGTCASPSAQNIPLSTAWTQVMLPWAMFTGGLANGVAYTPTGANISGLNFQSNLTYVQVDAGPDGAAIYGPAAATLDFQIDDVEFMP